MDAEQLTALNQQVVELIRKKLLPEGVEDLANAALPIMKAIGQRDAKHSGENKLHQVYSAMIKNFPHEPHWKIGLAIEWAYSQHFIK